MSSIWLEAPRINAVPYRLFITKGKPQVLATIVFADDKRFYLVYSKDIAGVVKDLIVPSPFIDPSKKRYLVFRVGRRLIRANGYLVVVDTKYSLDLLTEEVRYVIGSAIDKPIKVRKLKSEEELPRVSKKLSEEEKKIFEMAPIDVPVELEEEISEELVIEQESEEEQNEEAS